MTQELCCINFLDLKHFKLQSDLILTITNMAVVEGLLSLLENEDFREPIDRAARILYTGQDFTLNLIPGAIAGFLPTLAAGAIFSVPLTQFFNNMFSAAGSGSGYGYPSSYQRNDEYYDQVVADLHSQVAALKEQEENLRTQIYYSNYNSAPGEA